MKPGDLVVFCSNKSYTERVLLRDHLTWAELRGKVLDGEVCVVLEVENIHYDSCDVKVLDQRGGVGWTLSRYFRVVENQ